MTLEVLKESIESVRDYLNNNRNHQVIELSNKLLISKQLHKDKELLSKVYNFLGIAYNNLSDYSNALINYEKTLLINEDLGIKANVAINLGNIGIVYQYLGEYPKALNYLERALKLNEEIKNRKGIADNLSIIGIIYQHLSNLSKALEYIQKSLYIFEELGDKSGIARNSINIGNINTELLNYKLALEYNEIALSIYQEIDEKMGSASALGNIGNVYYNLLEYPKAIEFFSQSLKMNEEIKNKFGVNVCLGSIGCTYLRIEDYPKAIDYLSKAYSIAIEIGEKHTLKEWLNALSEVYEKLGDINSAFSYFKQYIEVKEEIQSEDAQNKAQLFDQRRKIEEDEKARQLKLARFQEQERIFHNILPISIANRLIEGELSIAESFENVSIFFSDIVGFTTLSTNIEPSELVKGLNTIFTAFDRIGTIYCLEKIKTIGDAYMAVCGVPESYEDHALRTANFALEAIAILPTLQLHQDFQNLQFRIGLHSGGVVAGIIGEKKFAYDVWGDAVNVASRMESNSEAGRIHISEQFAKAIESYPEFTLIPRGAINIKGKGTMNTFWLEKVK